MVVEDDAGTVEEFDSEIDLGAGFATGFDPKNDRISAPGFGACFDILC